MRTTLSRTSNLLAVAMGVLVTSAATVHAQGAPGRRVFVDVGAGGQVSTRTFSESSAFTVFNETALVATNQATGRGFVFDANGGYRFARNLHVGVGFWVARPDGASASAASIPDPLVFNRPKTLTFTASDLSQTNTGVNFQIGWSTLIGSRVDLAIAGGPSIVHVKQDLSSVAVTPNSQNATATIVRESATTAKAGNAGVEVGYRLNDRYGLGVFARYAGGQVDLPSVSNLTVGGAQIGGRMRVWF